MSLPSQPLQLRSIRRKQVQQYLVVSACVTTQLLVGCNQAEEQKPPVSPTTTPALFYKNQAQCEKDARQQQSEYQTALKAASPEAYVRRPDLEVKDCAAQMKLAKTEHDRHAPLYLTQSECEAEGVRCEYSDGSGSTDYSLGYRPRFGGTYLYPNGNPMGDSGFVYAAGRQVYQPRTVYESKTAGAVVTPQGDSINQMVNGRVQAPDNAGVAAPSRPEGYAAKGTITGRSQAGFGSSYKGTGRGGK